MRFTARSGFELAALVLSFSNLAASEQAIPTICVAARKDWMPVRERLEAANYLLKPPMRHEMDNDSADLGHERWLRFWSWNWLNFYDAISHCSKKCLAPAATWGFDAAVCQLQTDKWNRHVSVGYGPGDEYHCFSWDDCSGDEQHTPWPTERLAVALYDKNKQPASFSPFKGEVWWLDDDHLGWGTWQSQGDTGEPMPKWNPMAQNHPPKRSINETAEVGNGRLVSKYVGREQSALAELARLID